MLDLAAIYILVSVGVMWQRARYTEDTLWRALVVSLAWPYWLGRLIGRSV